ncbi:MAG: nucleoid-associated protein [Candidatus Pacearchaeota archaeon]|nr:nucleoid-associated protein [Candidatus Pacearchaeota archaeon]
MQLVNAIGHMLRKNRQEASELKTRDDVWNNTEALIIHLAESIQELYGKKSAKHWGTFEADSVSYPFQTLLIRYLNEEDNFVVFTQAAVGLLQSRIDTEHLATGGYIVFFHYKHGAEDFLQIVMIDDVTGTAIDPDAITVKEAIHLDLSHLHVGGRINITKWINEDERYLSFIKGKGNEVSRYFRFFLGCTDYTTAKDATNQLVKAVRAYAVHNDFSSEDKAEFEHKVFQFCEEKRRVGEDVLLSALSAYIDPENPESFFEFANGEPHQVDTVVTPDRNTYKRLQYISHSKGELKISFPRTMLQDTIDYNSNDGTLLIKDLPDELKKQLSDEE